jgi:hypothetical protein
VEPCHPVSLWKIAGDATVEVTEILREPALQTDTLPFSVEVIDGAAIDGAAVAASLAWYVGQLEATEESETLVEYFPTTRVAFRTERDPTFALWKQPIGFINNVASQTTIWHRKAYSLSPQISEIASSSTLGVGFLQISQFYQGSGWAVPTGEPSGIFYNFTTAVPGLGVQLGTIICGSDSLGRLRLHLTLLLSAHAPDETLYRLFGNTGLETMKTLAFNNSGSSPLIKKIGDGLWGFEADGWLFPPGGFNANEANPDVPWKWFNPSASSVTTLPPGLTIFASGKNEAHYLLFDLNEKRQM